MRILSDEIDAMTKRQGAELNNDSYVLIESGMCRMPVFPQRRAFTTQNIRADEMRFEEDFVPDLHDGNLHSHNSSDGRIVNMRVNIKMRVRQSSGATAPPTTPTKTLDGVMSGSKAPPPTPNTSLTDIGNAEYVQSQNMGIDEEEYEPFARKRAPGRNRSAPPMISQYRTRLSSTSSWIKKRAVAEASNSSIGRSQACMEAVLVERPSTSVRPFSERENPSESNLSKVRILPPSQSSRIPMPDFGSFRGHPPISISTRTFSRQRRVTNSSNQDRISESDSKSKSDDSNFEKDSNSSTLIPKSMTGSKIDQYVSELRKTLKSNTFEAGPKRVKPFSVWAVSGSNELSNLKSNWNDTKNELSSTSESSEENFERSFPPRMAVRKETSVEKQTHNGNQNNKANEATRTVKQEVIRQLDEPPPDGDKEETRVQNFLEVKGDSPPRNIRKTLVGFEPAQEKCSDCGGSFSSSNKNFPPTKRRASLSTSAQRGALRYGKQTEARNIRLNDVRSVTCYHNNATRTVRLPSYVEFRVINRTNFYQQTLPYLKLKIHPPRLLNYGTGSDVISRDSQPFTRALIGKQSR